MSDTENCGQMQIFHVASRPSRHFVRVGRSKLWQNGDWGGLLIQNCGKMGILGRTAAD